MEYNTPSSYKNYLPSKKIQIVIVILIIIGLLYFFAPWAVKKIKTIATPVTTKTSLIISTPTGDPTSRDTDGDGVPDWQEIAIGLDINNPQTKPGIPDLTTFETIKQKVGNDTFDLEAGQVDDTDKVSLTIYDALSKDSTKNDGVSVAGAQSVTSQELYNYIDAQKAQIKIYLEKDILITENSLDASKTYAKTMKAATADTAVTKNATETIKKYIEGTTDRASITPLLDILGARIKALTTTPVPRAIVGTHLEALNSIQEIYQLLSDYPEKNTDAVLQMSTGSLLQDGLIRATKSLGILTIYFSIALDSNGYSQSQ